MQKIKTISALLAFAAVICFAADAVAAPEKADARSAILIECDTGTVMYEQNADERLPIASVTKIMTLCLIFDRIEAGSLACDDLVQISENAAGMGGSQVFLDAGESYAAGDLIKSIIIASGNDACVAMAEHTAGSQESFVSLMNDKAKALGMENTHFVNCTGMPAPEHYSTARDVAVMSRELIKHELFFKWSNIWMDELAHKGGRITGLTNTNKLVRFFDGCDGIKTGYTSEAGHCVAATVKRDNMRLISVIIGGKTSQGRFDDARNLINYGFANYKKTELLQPGMLPDAIELKNGMTDSVRVKPDGLPSVILEKSREGNIEARTDIPQSLNAPVKAGDRVGGIVFLLDGREIAKVNVVADQDGVQATVGEFFSKLIRHW